MDKIIVVLGTNASGKSAIGVELAKIFNGEIISADSRQIYKGLDLGSGKMSFPEMQNIKHHLIDILEPGEAFSVMEFQDMAYSWIEDILERAKLPFIVGGTGLYIRSVVNGYVFANVLPDLVYRETLEQREIDSLCEELHKKDVDISMIDITNKRRVIRALEKIRGGMVDLRENTSLPHYLALQIGVTWPKKLLHERIEARLRQRLNDGMIEEVVALRKNGASDEFLNCMGLEYRYILWYLNGKIKTLDDFTEEMGNAIKKFAKKQLTWFKKDRDIIWLDMECDYVQQAQTLIASFLHENS
jgi:tRNA dimethylallyltransferase